MDSILHIQSVVPIEKYLELSELNKKQQDLIAELRETRLDQAQRMIEALATIAYVGIMDSDVLPGGTLTWLEEMRGDYFFDDEI